MAKCKRVVNIVARSKPKRSDALALSIGQCLDERHRGKKNLIKTFTCIMITWAWCIIISSMISGIRMDQPRYSRMIKMHVNRKARWKFGHFYSKIPKFFSQWLLFVPLLWFVIFVVQFVWRRRWSAWAITVDENQMVFHHNNELQKRQHFDMTLLVSS